MGTSRLDIYAWREDILTLIETNKMPSFLCRVTFSLGIFPKIRILFSIGKKICNFLFHLGYIYTSENFPRNRKFSADRMRSTIFCKDKILLRMRSAENFPFRGIFYYLVHRTRLKSVLGRSGGRPQCSMHRVRQTPNAARLLSDACVIWSSVNKLQEFKPKLKF